MWLFLAPLFPVLSCGTSDPTTVYEAAVAAVTVEPNATELTAIGTTVQLTAQVTDQNGWTLTDQPVSWMSTEPAVATVTPSGLVVAVSNGTTTITASATSTSGGSGTVSGTATVTVAQVVGRVTVSPPAETIEPGDTLRLIAEAHDANGHPVTGAEFAWHSSDVSVARVDGSGFVQGVGEGSATITASPASGTETVSGRATLTVARSVSTVAVSPTAETIELGDTLRLVAEAYDANGQPVNSAEFAWHSSDVSVARVDNSGFVQGVGEGSATITATSRGARGTSEIVVVSPDRAILAALYHATNGRNWINNDGWLTNAPLGEWYGVETDSSGRVVVLELAGRWDSDAQQWIRHGLVGSIPSGIGSLASLRALALDHNTLTGPIPPELGSLSALTRLDLDQNTLTGPIPPELGSLSALERLDLGGNVLTGPIPPELGGLASLRALYLGGNRLTGSIPRELSDLASLRSLSLCCNRLTGSIPREFGNLSALDWIDLGRNDLTGSIPRELGDLASLGSLYLGDNTLTGSIPRELGDLASLERLRLERNRLTGAIPTELGNLDNLDQLRLHDNSLTSAIPTSFLGLSLTEFYWARNAGLCAPDTAAFRAWLNGIERADRGLFCAGR